MTVTDTVKEELSDETVEKIDAIVTKSNRSEDTVYKIANVEKEHVEDEEQLVTILSKRFKPAMSSDSKEFRGLIIGAGDARDIMESRRERRKQAYRDNADAAVKAGKTDADGTPLRMADDPFNGEVGEPLGEQWVRNIYGIIEEADESSDDVRFMDLTIFGEEAKKRVPIGKTVKFIANESDDERNNYDMNVWNLVNSSATTLEEVNMELPEVTDLIDQYVDVHDLDELEKWHKRHGDDNITMFVKGYVNDIRETNNGTTLLELAQGGRAESNTVFLPDGANPEFGIGSDVIIFGRTWLGDSMDEDSNEKELNIQAFNFFSLEATGPAGESDELSDELVEDAASDDDSDETIDVTNPEKGEEATDEQGVQKTVTAESDDGGDDTLFE